MNSATGPEVLNQLRRAFDEAFAAPAVHPAEDLTTLIAIRVAGQVARPTSMYWRKSCVARATK